MEIEKLLYDEYPLWQIEDKLTEARQAAQNGNREKCKEITKEALQMLEESPKEQFK
jgi:hypothetical protein